jgi:hypothetical protein
MRGRQLLSGRQRHHLYTVRTRLLLQRQRTGAVHALRRRHLSGSIRSAPVHPMPRRPNVGRWQHELHRHSLPTRPVRQQRQLHALLGGIVFSRRYSHRLHPLQRGDLRERRWIGLLPAMPAQYLRVLHPKHCVHAVPEWDDCACRKLQLHAHHLFGRPVPQQRLLRSLSVRHLFRGRKRHRMHSVRGGLLCQRQRTVAVHALRYGFFQLELR